MKIFEIPIYSMRENTLNEKWEKYILRKSKNVSEGNKECFEKSIRKIYACKKQWIYNQIIGYLVISYSNNTIWFDEYLTSAKRIYPFSETKHYISRMDLNGYHFFVGNDMDNSIIKSGMIQWVDSFEKEILNKKYYLNRGLFDNLLKYTNIKQIINDIDNNFIKE